MKALSVVGNDSRNQETVKGRFAVDRSFFTKNKTAMMLGVTPSTLWRWSKDGLLVPIKIGRKRYYRSSDIEAFFVKSKGGNA